MIGQYGAADLTDDRYAYLDAEEAKRERAATSDASKRVRGLR